MNNTTLEEIVGEVSQRSYLDPKDIPCLDLYMDQIMTLFETFLSNHKRNEDDKLITKTMINNYSKEGILKPIKGKKYSKEHIIQMLIIYSLKNTITIQEIKNVLAPFHEDTKQIEPIYQQYLDTIKSLIEDKSNDIINFIQESHYDCDDAESLLSLLLIISSLSTFYQNIAQKIIDNYYKED